VKRDPKRKRSGAGRLAGAGFELASYALILGGIGYAADQWLGNQQPWIGIAGLIVGFCLGFYRLIQLAGEIE